MSFPWIDEVNFEDGTRGNFNSESDNDNKLDFPHYSDLAKDPRINVGPFRGAYCMRIDLSGGTADARLSETTTWDMALAETQHWRCMMYVSNLTMADGDFFRIFRIRSSGGTVEAIIGIDFTTANGLRIGVGETTASQFLPLQTDIWHAVELGVTLDDGASNNGTLDLRLDGSAASQVTGLNQAAITDGDLGAMGIDAGTTSGILLFDQVVTDDARIFPIEQRFPETVLMTTSGHVFVGDGRIKNVQLLSGAATDNVLTLFDTDVGNTDDASKIVSELKNTVNSELVDAADRPLRFERGCYVNMTGTNPRALVHIDKAPHYGSDGAVRRLGARWRPTTRNV